MSVRKDTNLLELGNDGVDHLRGKGVALSSHYGDSGVVDFDGFDDEDIVSTLEDERLMLENYRSSIEEYNNNIMNLDSDYSEGLSLRGDWVLLRMFKQYRWTKGGLFMGPDTYSVRGVDGKPKVKINPFSFESRGIVVNVGDSVDDLSAGDYVQVNEDVLRLQNVADQLVLPVAFARFDAYRENEEDLGRHFGYIKIPKYKIDARIKDTSN